MTTLPSGPAADPATAAATAVNPPPADTTLEATQSENDPFEGFNRKIFWFNDHLDTYVLEPVARAWGLVLPTRVETSVANFFWNLHFPLDTVNSLLQGKFKNAGESTGRFIVNTTVGVAGLFDPATSIGLDLHWEDFGQTLGWWGVGTGPYLMLPILGPSDLRDGVGLIADSATSVTPFFIDSYILLGARTVEIVNIRALYLDTINKAKESSFDYYSFVRNAYLQRRQGWVNDQGPGAGDAQEPGAGDAQEDLYYPKGN